MQSLGWSISNETLTLENAVNYQVYLIDAINCFKKSMRARLSEKIYEKDVTLKNTNELIKGKQWVIKAFESGTFSLKTSIVLHPNRILTPWTPATPPIIL